MNWLIRSENYSYQVPVEHSVDPSQVVTHGPGIEGGKVRAGVPVKFKVDGSQSGKAPLAVDIKSDKGNKICFFIWY